MSVLTSPSRMACRTRPATFLVSSLDMIRPRWPSTVFTLRPRSLAISGLDCPQQASVEEVAEKTVDCLLKNIPRNVGGVAFLSGGLDSASIDGLRQTLTELDTGSVVVTDANGVYLGVVYQHQLLDRDEGSVCDLERDPGTCFDENTSIWEAMEIMRNYIGEAIAVVDSRSGRYLGAVPEAAVINAYLDASHELRREEHEV